jgi:ABC-type lipoprotein release transport system permease subunit
LPRQPLWIPYPFTGLLESFVYGITPTDPLTIGGAVLGVLVTAALASVIPARRAMRLDVTEVLRGD